MPPARGLANLRFGVQGLNTEKCVVSVCSSTERKRERNRKGEIKFERERDALMILLFLSLPLSLSLSLPASLPPSLPPSPELQVVLSKPSDTGYDFEKSAP